jgi:hypothetical protein
LLPFDFKTKLYGDGDYWRIEPGKHDITLWFNKKIPPELLKAKEDIVVEDVVMPMLDQFNSFGLNTQFRLKGVDLTDKVGCMPGGILYEYKAMSQCYLKQKKIAIRMGIVETSEAKGLLEVLKHEFIHALGFCHKSDNFGIRREFYDKKEFNRDDVHGLDVVYNYASKIMIFGHLKSINNYDVAEAYIMNATNELVYQSPIDSTGYFEFRLRKKPPDQLRFCVRAKDKNGILYTSVSKKPEFDKLRKVI